MRDSGGERAMLGVSMRYAIPVVLCVLAASGLGSDLVGAQGLEAGKDCHVILTCNFSRHASVRGCLSSYSCRQCQFIKRSMVTIDGARRSEYRSVCEWGAS